MMIDIKLLVEKLALPNTQILRASDNLYAAAVRNRSAADLGAPTIINVLTDEELSCADVRMQGACFVIGDRFPRTLPEDQDTVIVHETISPSKLLEMISQIISEYQRYCDYVAQFRLLCQKSSDITEIFNLFSSYYDNPVCFGDHGGNILLTANLKKDFDDWDESIKYWMSHGYVPYEHASKHGNIAGASKVANSPEPVIMSEGFASKYRRMSYRTCYSGGLYNNYLAIVEVYDVYKCFDRDALKFSGDMLTEQFAARPNDFNHTMIETPRNHTLRRLLTPSLTGSEKEIIRGQFKRLHIPENCLHMLVVIESAAANQPEPSSEYGFVTFTHRYLLRIINNSRSNAIGIIEGNQIVLLFQGATKKIVYERFAALKEQLSSDMLLSHSRIYSDIFDTCCQYERAKFALEIGKIVKPKSRTYSFQDLYFYALIELAGEKTDLRNLICDDLFVLEASDREHGTEYLRTLYEYLRCGQNINEVSSRLRLHRNTVTYRIKKIRELVDLDFDDFGTLCKLFFSCHCFEIYENFDLHTSGDGKTS